MLTAQAPTINNSPEEEWLVSNEEAKKITVQGRLSYPTWDAQSAFDLSQKGKFPAKSVAEAAPSFLMVVTQAQWDKFRNHAVNVFLPYCAEQTKKGERIDALEAKEVKALIDGLEGDLADQMYNTPAKAVSPKTLELVPDAVATIKAIGPKGGTIVQKAVAYTEFDLVVPDPDQLIWPCVKDISVTKHEMYPGALVAATLNLYAYRNGKHPGFSAGVKVCVFKQDADQFGGSVAVDEDAIFAD
jgi:hypothetical protein